MTPVPSIDSTAQNETRGCKQSWVTFSDRYTVATLSGFGLVMLFFSQYITTAIPAYVLLVISLFAGGKLRLPVKIYLYLAAVVIYWLAVFGHGIAHHLFTNLVFYFGFLIPLLVMENHRVRGFFMTERFVIFLCLLILAEAVLVNSQFAPFLHFLPPDGSSERVQFFGFYQRPMGFSGNASMTSVVLIFIVTLIDCVHNEVQLSTKLLVVGAVLLLASGTGFALLLVYILIYIIRSLMKGGFRGIVGALAYALVFSLGALIATNPFSELENFDKFSTSYIKFILNSKLMALVEELDGDTGGMWLFGQQVQVTVAATSGDFGFLVTASAIGLIGAVLLFGAPMLYANAIPLLAVPTLFFFISFAHYPGLLSPPGQVVFAYYINRLAHTKGKPRNREK
jgi:hypothetical protein